MPHLGHVLVGDVDTDAARNRLLSLKHAGYKGWHASDAETLMRLATERRPDVILLGPFAEPGQMEIAVQCRDTAATSRIPVFLLDNVGTDASRQAAVETGVADIASYSCPTDILLARLPRIVRMSRLIHELERRQATAADLGRAVAAAPADAVPDSQAGYKVLVVANAHLYEKSVYASVFNQDLDAELESDAYRATDRIDKNGVDAAIVMVDSGEDRDKIGYFCTHVRNNTRLNALPILAIDDAGQAETLYRVGASVVLERDKNAARAVQHVKLLVNRQRFQRTLLQPLASILGPETADDGLPDAYSGRFFKIHLRRSIVEAIERETGVGIACFRIPTIARIRDTVGPEQASALKELVLDRIVELVRPTDTVAILDEYEIGVILCDADDREGYRIANRITGIMQNTDYRIDGDAAPLRIIVQCGVAGLKQGDTADTLLARARENLV
ncbi:MAG: diguanylate cyclase [Alphaproteobacteria bacterium]